MREDTARDLTRLLAQPIAHRGLHGCGGDGPVENSLGAARAAVAAGYAIECDVQLSRDGEAMVFHDTTLARLTGTEGLLAEHDAAALGRLRLCGGSEHVPALSELLSTIGGAVPLVIEIKSAGDSDVRIANRTLALIADYSGPVAIESFDPHIISFCRERQVTRPLGLVGPPEAGCRSDPTALAACDFLSWSIDHLVEVARLHPGLPRSTWTVRTVAQHELATQNGAQIVFEGLVPLPTVNPTLKD